MIKIDLYKGDCLCISESIFLKKEVLADGILGWQSLPVTVDSVWYSEIGCLIDKRDDTTYLRIVHIDDYSCLDTGEK